jgi:hypothetical protein
VRSPRPGRARSCSELSPLRSACRQPWSPWNASTIGSTALAWRSSRAGPNGQGVGGRDPCLACHRRLLQRAHRGRQPAHQEGQAGRAWLPQLRHLPPTAAAALRRQVADAPHRTTARPLPTLGRVEPVHETLRRLIGSSVVVGPASVSRRHERPSRIAVSRRSGTSRPPRWAARLQARVGLGSASPPPVEPTVLASALPLLPVWPGVPCGCWPTRRCCHLGKPNGRGHWAQLRRDPRPLPQKAGERRHQAKGPRVGARALGALGHLPAAPLVHCTVRWQTHRTTSLRGRSHAWWRRAGYRSTGAFVQAFCLGPAEGGRRPPAGRP